MRALLFVLIALVCHAQDYFPAGAFSKREDLHQFSASWFSSQLKALKEPPLFTPNPSKDMECYRFTWLRTFHRPVILRVDVTKKGEAIFTIKVADGAGGYEPGKLMRNEKKPLDERALKKLKALIEHSEFFGLPSYEETSGLDGSEWIVEVVAGGRYHIVSRGTPSDGPVHQIGIHLIELAIGGDFTPIY